MIIEREQTMICPKCGQQNPDSAAMCTNCYYKFNFGHAHGDPGRTFYFGSSSPKKKWVSIALIIVFVFFIVMFILSLISSLQCNSRTSVAKGDYTSIEQKAFDSCVTGFKSYDIYNLLPKNLLAFSQILA
jgi:uncharacterized membrane protein YvbJ